VHYVELLYWFAWVIAPAFALSSSWRWGSSSFGPSVSSTVEPMPNPKRPRDPNQRAKLIVEIATGESDEPKGPPKDSPD